MTERRWAKPDEPYCGAAHPKLKYLCGWNAGHSGDHMEGICHNSWPNESETAADEAVPRDDRSARLVVDLLQLTDVRFNAMTWEFLAHIVPLRPIRVRARLATMRYHEIEQRLIEAVSNS